MNWNPSEHDCVRATGDAVACEFGDGLALLNLKSNIYYSLNKNGAWTGSKNLGPKVNSRFRDYSPRISPDGKYLFYTSEKDFSATQSQISDYPTLERYLHGVLNGSGNIYCIEIKDLDLK